MILGELLLATVLNIYLFLFYVHMCVPECMYVYNKHVGACEDQKRMLGPLELEL